MTIGANSYSTVRDLGAFQILEQRAAGYALFVLFVVTCILYPWQVKSTQPIPAARETYKVNQ